MSTLKIVLILVFSSLYVQTNAGRPNCRGPNGEDLCQNGGICTKNLFSGAPNVCICPQRFDDEMYCKNRVKLCLQGGTFNETIQECDCVEPGYGIYCEYDRTKCKCQNGGECYASYIGLDLCRCPEGFGGEKCQFRLHTPDECSLLTSYNPETHQCDCLPGYRKMDDDVCVDVDECEETSPCRSGSSCSNVIGSYTCLNCPPHMTGRNCDVSRKLDGDVTCLNDDVSNSTVCLNGGRCSTEGAYMCECKPGFSGRRCEDEWSLCEISNKCSDNSTCVQTLDSYLCNCDDGFSGARCHLMTSCDNVTSCANGGECAVYDGVGDDVSGDVTMYKCECRRGYEGHRCQFQQEKEEKEVVTSWASMARITAIVLACVVITLVIGTIVAYVTVRRRTRQRYEVEERRRRHNHDDVIQSNEVSVTPTSSHLSSSSAGDMLHFATDKV